MTTKVNYTVQFIFKRNKIAIKNKMLCKEKVGDAPLTRSEQKRMAILESARAAFLDKGFESVSMDMIAENANVSKRTVYSHFGSKEELFGNIMLVACTTERGEIFSEINLERPVEDVLMDIGRNFLSFMFDEETIALLQILIGNADRLADLSIAFFDSGPRESIETLGAYLQAMNEKGAIKVDDPNIAAEGLMASLMGIAQMRSLATNLPSPDEAEIEKRVQIAVKGFLYGAVVR